MYKSKLPPMITFFAIPFIAHLLYFALLPTYPAQAAPRAGVDDIAIITVTHLSLQANDIISDPTHGVIYASIPSAAGAQGNRIAPIELPNGNIGKPLFVGSEPNRMAISNDGQYLYVGIDGADAIRRVNLNTYTADLQIPLGGGFCGPNVAKDMVVLQNDPHALAVVKDDTGCTGVVGVFIYDDGVARPDSAGGPYDVNVIEPTASPSILYGFDNETTGYYSSILTVTATGVAISSTQSGPSNGFDTDIQFHGGMLYGTDGQVVDPLSLTSLGTYDAHGPLVVDSKKGVVYFGEGSFDGGTDLKLFNQTDYIPIQSLSLCSGPMKLNR